MRKKFILGAIRICLVLGISLGSGVLFSQDSIAGDVEIKLIEGDWGAGKADILAVLRSSTEPLLAQFPDHKAMKINVESQGGPIVLYRRDPGNAYRVKLNVKGMYWSQYAYQFSHELCHILCQYREGPNWNGWFEESLCELASLYSLRVMGETWKTDAPYPNWKGYGKSLNQYAQKMIDETEVPEDLSKWYRFHREALQSKATDRAKNRVAAVAMLPIFEKSPDLWIAIASINAIPNREVEFPEFLREWHKASPEPQRRGVAEVAKLFQVDLSDN